MAALSPQYTFTANVAATQITWPLADAKTGLCILRSTGSFGSGTLTITGTLDGTNFYTLATQTAAGQSKFNWVGGNLYYTVTGSTTPAVFFTVHSATASQ